ncbi:MAG: DnaA regulatory inactivator Hda [Proteobacteria bacterium]|jgi:DnaA-homolog protein|nr:DnaA regulatory inactivator Hda [Pseudomonadota bacterium]
MPHNFPQLPLGIGLRDSATFDNFLPDGNELALQALRDDREAMLYLWGPAGSGKTHLLQALCHHAVTRGESLAFLPMGELAPLSHGMLEGLEQQAVIGIDDVQAIARLPDWEEALFHLYNRVRDAGHRLVVSGTAAPHGLGLSLPDLVTRLGWGPVFRLVALDDAGKRRALQLGARRRGMAIPDEVADYLLRHSPRDMNSLFALLDRLDRASLAAQRKLTIPFVRELIR